MLCLVKKIVSRVNVKKHLDMLYIVINVLWHDILKVLSNQSAS